MNSMDRRRGSVLLLPSEQSYADRRNGVGTDPHPRVHWCPELEENAKRAYKVTVIFLVF